MMRNIFFRFSCKIKISQIPNGSFYFLAELIIDQSGNNVLIDGELNPQNIIRVDITNSQSGTVNGQFGYSADYFIITYNEPL